MSPSGTTHELSRQQARRIAVQAQLLDVERPADLLDLVDHLTFLQLDHTTAVAPSHHVVAWSRLGSGYVTDELTAALRGRALVEVSGQIRPADDVALYRAEMAQWPGPEPLLPWQHRIRDWVQANDRARRDVLARLTADGPLATGELPDTVAVPWESSGWTNDRNLGRLLDFMTARGEVAVVGRRGQERLWDLAERVYPDDPVVPAEQAWHRRDVRRLQSLGVAPARAARTPNEPNGVGAAGEPARIEGVKGVWRVDPAWLDRPFTGRTALLSPLDRLVFDRKRMAQLFEFDYQLEMYKPVAARRWGYWALPVLHGDRLVGKVDATADRTRGVLRVDAVHEDDAFDTALTRAVQHELDDLAAWLDLELVRTR